MNKKSLHNETQKETTKMQTTTPDALLTLGELAGKLHIHPGTLRGLWRRRAIPALKIGHRTLRFEYKAVLDALRRAGDPAADQAEK
jgi:membrane protein required for beta-lactamase induction